MSEKIIMVNVTNCPKADWETLKKYESNSLKKDFKDEKRDVSILKNAIINRGFNFPLYIWDEHQYIIDGAGRMKALLELESEGYTIPELPIVTVRADSFEQAKHLVLQASSQHGEITQASFDAFVADINIDDILDSISIPDVKLPGAAGGANEPEGDPDEPMDPPDDPVTVTGDIYEIGPHRLICGDSTVITDVEKVMNGQLADMVCTDPPYNADYTGKTKDALKIENDKKDDASFFQFLYDVYINLFAVSKEGAAIYVFHADSEGMNFRKAMLDAGWLLKQCCIWVKNVMVMGRRDYHWQHEPCQPAGTMVRTPNGEVPIEDLKNGDCVVSYDSYSGVITGMRDGRRIKTASRHYNGLLYGVQSGGNTTWVTDTHRFTVKFHDSSKSIWCTYLMRRGNWWRIGVTKTYDARGFGLKNRFKTEEADEAWIITTHGNRLDAFCEEQILSVKYGIPRTHWTTDRGFNNCQSVRTPHHINRIYESMNLDKMEEGAALLLSDYGRNINYPFLNMENLSIKFSTRVTMQIPACNLIPEIMSVPIPYKKWDLLKTFDWMPIDCIKTKNHDGIVYSLAVEKDEHYIADGIVTHNCLYGWKPGASHNWYTDRKQTTVWNFDRPSRNEDHPTMKPIDLICYPIMNSSQDGGLVVDFFLGSGSTMVAAHTMGRICYGLEMDPRYCDVIVKRMKKLFPNLEIKRNGITIEKL